MPYYGSGIMQQNTNTLRGLAQDKEQSEINTLNKKRLKQEVNIADRKEYMERAWIAGQTLNSVVDEPSYQQARKFALSLSGGDETKSDWPQNFEKDFVDRKKAEANIMYEALGKGKPLEVPMSITKDGEERKTRAIFGSPQYKRMIEAGWKQGELVQPPSRGKTVDEELKLYEEKKKIDVRYPSTSGDGSDFERSYQQYLTRHPGAARDEFRQNAWLKQKEWSVQQVLMYDRYERRHNKLQDTIEDLDMKLSQIDPTGKSEDSFIQGMRKQLERKKRDLELTQSKMDGMLGTEKSKAREYQTAEEVRNDFINGDITEEEAAKILRSTFKYK